MLTTLKEVLGAADQGGYAVGAFNVNNLEILRAVIDTAVEKKSPVIIQTSEGAIEYAGMEYLVALVKVAAQAPVPVVFHVDHGKNLDLIHQAIDSGYSSVMFDGSILPHDENVAKTKQVVEWARAKGVSVEAEIGAIKGVEDLVSVSEKEAFFTNPEEAVKFAEETGCDALAISIGTAHGAFKSKMAPELDIERLAKIDELVKVPLVLHGASGIIPDVVELTKYKCETLGDCDRLSGAVGIPDDQITAAIKHGIRKINIDSDLRLAFTAGLRQTVLDDHKNIDPRKWLAPSIKLMSQVVSRKMDLFGCAGKA